jgi:GTP-binding protein
MVRALSFFAGLATTASAFQSTMPHAHRARVVTSAGADEELKLRNIAIIAHVDHGKTTLVDAMLRNADVFRANEDQGERVMDSNDQERERGITILAKNAAIRYEGHKINIVDTPGHADFGGEVERIMNMVDGVLLVVDSVEGPKPQTRFVLRKALERGIKPMLVVNKIDRPSARPEYVVDKTFDLFCELGATDEQTDFDICYTSAINGLSGDEPDDLKDSMHPLFDKILGLPAPPVTEASAKLPRQCLIANIDYDDFKGKLGIGRVTAGTLKVGDQVGYMKPGEDMRTGKVAELFVFDNLGRTNVDEVKAGEIAMIAGLEDIQIGDTIVSKEDPQPMEPIAVEEPTVRMTFSVNKSPMAGKDPKSSKLTSRVIRDRLMKELDRNVALRVEDDPESADTYIVSGRGQLHLTVLIETMRREGFELMIGAPTVIYKKGPNGEKLEPFEEVECTVPEEYVGSVVDILSRRKGSMLDMTVSGQEGTTTIKYVLPTRGILGLRNAALTATRGTAVLDSIFHDYLPFAGEIEARDKGSLIAYEDGVVTPHGIQGAQDRGLMFVPPRIDVYKDMIIGIHQRPGDLKVNICKQKALTNMRASGSDNTVKLTPPIEMSLDSMVEYINEEEVVEVTPAFMRMAKKQGWDKKAKSSGRS